MREAGEQATFDVGAHGVHVELIKILGRLNRITSYNVCYTKLLRNRPAGPDRKTGC